MTVPRPAFVPTMRGLRELAGALGIAAARAPELTVGALGVLVSAAFAWVPSLWYDEGATVTSATRSWAALWAEVHNVDAVHGLYYACMHAWFWLVGYSPFTLRFPSALAVGVAAALVVALGRRIGGLRLGIVSGVLFVVLPRVVWAGGEGRPYATVTALSAALTLVGLAAVRSARPPAAGASAVPRSRWRGVAWWGGYGVLAAVAVTFNVYLALVVVAHGAAIVWTALDHRAELRRNAGRLRDAAPPRPLVSAAAAGRWATAAALAAVVVVPVVLEVISQSGQVGWIDGVRWATVHQVFATAWFGGSRSFATVAWALMVLGVVLALRAARRSDRTVRDRARAQTVRVALPLVVLPTGILVTVTAFGEHLYSPKYASLSLPFVALLMGLALTAIRPRVTLAVAVVTVLALTIPTTVGVKTPQAKQDSTWVEAAAILEQQRTLRPSANEGVIYGSVYRHPTTTAQIIRDAYPSAFQGLTDLAAVTTGADTGQLWDTNGPVATTVPSRLGDIDTVWFVGGPTRNIQPEVTETLDAEGFTVAGYWRTGEVILTEYTRAPR